MRRFRGSARAGHWLKRSKAKKRRRFKKVIRAAHHRLAAARALLVAAYRRDAIYLGGYVVECGLKALILDRSPKIEFEETFRLLTTSGAKGHDFGFLRELYTRRFFGLPLTGDVKLPSKIVFPVAIADALRRVWSWETIQRYETTLVPYADAADFLAAVELILEWVERSIS